MVWLVWVGFKFRHDVPLIKKYFSEQTYSLEKVPWPTFSFMMCSNVVCGTVSTVGVDNLMMSSPYSI